MAVVRYFPDSNALRYVLFSMTLCFHIMGHMVRGVGSNDVGAVLKQEISISNVFTRGASLVDFVVVHSGSKWRRKGRGHGHVANFNYLGPNHISATATATVCGLGANLGCRSETCCTRLAENTGRKISPKIHHLGTITQLCRAISSQLGHVCMYVSFVKLYTQLDYIKLQPQHDNLTSSERG